MTTFPSVGSLHEPSNAIADDSVLNEMMGMLNIFVYGYAYDADTNAYVCSQKLNYKCDFLIQANQRTLLTPWWTLVTSNPRHTLKRVRVQ